MSEEPEERLAGRQPASASQVTAGGQVRPAILSVLVLSIVCGCVFPVILYAVGRPLFSRQADGSLLTRDGVVIGSALIGQEFTRAEYFHSRPSAAGSGYDGTASGGTNLDPNSPKLRNGDRDFAGIRQLAGEYRRQNGLSGDTPIPVDAVTRSASGLDPDISPANAELQVARVAKARGVAEDDVRRMVAEHTQGPQFGFLGSPRVSVLALNLELDARSKSGAALQPR